jgi:hypothetical protein
MKHRFLVLSIESKLLVMLPTQHGELVAICPKELAHGDELTSEVVTTASYPSNGHCIPLTPCWQASTCTVPAPASTTPQLAAFRLGQTGCCSVVAA